MFGVARAENAPRAVVYQDPVLLQSPFYIRNGKEFQWNFAELELMFRRFLDHVCQLLMILWDFRCSRIFGLSVFHKKRGFVRFTFFVVKIVFLMYFCIVFADNDCHTAQKALKSFHAAVLMIYIWTIMLMLAAEWLFVLLRGWRWGAQEVATPLQIHSSQIDPHICSLGLFL